MTNPTPNPYGNQSLPQGYVPAQPAPKAPGLALPVVVTLLLNVIGAIPTFLAAKKAKLMGLDPLRYWMAFAVAFLVNCLLLLAAAVFLPGLMSDSRTATPARANREPVPAATASTPESTPQTSPAGFVPGASTTTSAPAPAQTTNAPATNAPATQAPATQPTTQPTYGTGDTGAEDDTGESTIENVEAFSLARLEQMRAASLRGYSFRGQFVAQLASKYPGVVDPHQKTMSGSNTFQTVDIMNEHDQLRSRFATDRVLLFKSTDYGKRQTINGHPLWVTVVSEFATKDAALAWCQRNFPGYSSTKDLENRCAVRQLNP